MTFHDEILAMHACSIELGLELGYITQSEYEKWLAGCRDKAVKLAQRR